jgi:hypothetical protein
MHGSHGGYGENPLSYLGLILTNETKSSITTIELGLKALLGYR